MEYLWPNGRCLHITLPHYHHYVDLFDISRLLKCLSGTFCLECVSKINTILTIFFHKIYGAVCIQLTHFSYFQNTCTLSYYHHQIGSRIHLPLLRVKSWNNGMRCMSFCFLIIISREVWSILQLQLTNIQTIDLKQLILNILKVFSYVFQNSLNNIRFRECLCAIYADIHVFT